MPSARDSPKTIELNPTPDSENAPEISRRLSGAPRRFMPATRMPEALVGSEYIEDIVERHRCREHDWLFASCAKYRDTVAGSARSLLARAHGVERHIATVARETYHRGRCRHCRVMRRMTPAPIAPGVLASRCLGVEKRVLAGTIDGGSPSRLAA